MIGVVVVGAAGRMGQEVIQAVQAEPDMEVIVGVDRQNKPQGAISMVTDLETALVNHNPDVVVDFTDPSVIRDNLTLYLKRQVRAVIGTTGLSEDDLVPFRAEARGKDWAALVAPNFAIGALLMIKFAKEAAEHFTHVEIIEYHHDQKLDAPSGTAIKTAETIGKVLQPSGNPDEVEIYPGARGAKVSGVPIHSVRLPGYVAHQEVILGLPGQNLVIRHDSTHRQSFMPGVIMAIRQIGDLSGITYGLEHILFG